MKYKTMVAPLFKRVIERSSLWDKYSIQGKPLEIFNQIKECMSVIEPTGDDETRLIWLEIPRGEITDWMSYIDAKREFEISTKKEFTEIWKAYYPEEIYWYYLTISTYRDVTYMHICDVEHESIIFCDDKNEKKYFVWNEDDMIRIFEMILDMVRKTVERIVSDQDEYNSHVEENFPYEKRKGRIRRKDLVRLLPKTRIRPKEYREVVKMLKDMETREKAYNIEHDSDISTFSWKEYNVPEPLDTMTIRTFCKYYHIADLVYRRIGNTRIKRHRRKEEREILEELDDLEYYRKVKFNELDEYDPDSPQDFIKFANDHYGELGLARMNVHASNYYNKGKWIITFGISYSAYVDDGLAIALELYRSGAPFYLYDAAKLLAIIQQKDYVLLTCHTFHDYLNHHEEGTVMSIPYESDCINGDCISLETRNEIIRLAEWIPMRKVRIEKMLPFEDPVYGLLKTMPTTPLTLSAIRRIVEKEYDIYIGIYYQDECTCHGYSSHLYDRKDRNENINDDTIYPSYKEALYNTLINYLRKHENNSNK